MLWISVGDIIGCALERHIFNCSFEGIASMKGQV